MGSALIEGIIKAGILKPVAEKPVEKEDIVIYRVQFDSNAEPKGSYEIKSGGRVYMTYEYLYNGLYRICAGEFSTLSQATNLQNALRKEGYPQAFVVAFKNNERSFDMSLFK